MTGIEREPRHQPPGTRKELPKRPKRVTMSDVATAAGVAQSTVSRILNGADLQIPVSQETRDRVRSLAKEMGYRPHPIARALRGAPTMLLGAIVRDITDQFFAGAVSALSRECKGRGYSVVLGDARATEDEALALTAVLEARQCDGLVVLGDFTDEHRLIEDLHNLHTPVVGVFQGSDSSRALPTVSVDNDAGVTAALQHLVDLGHRRIAFVGPDDFGDVRERLSAYHRFTAGRLGPLPAEYVQVTPNTVTAGAAPIAALLACEEPPTAIVTATDTIALGLLHAAHERGLTVPQDLSIVGFDDITMASAAVPALTTVRMPVAEIVAKAVELCLGPNAFDGDEPLPHLVMEPSLIVRASTAPPSAG